MKDLKERITEISYHLQQLIDPIVFPEVQNAVENKDKDLLIKVCRKIKIPEIYISVVVLMLLSVGPEQLKWPAPQF